MRLSSALKTVPAIRGPSCPCLDSLPDGASRISGNANEVAIFDLHLRICGGSAAKASVEVLLRGLQRSQALFQLRRPVPAMVASTGETNRDGPDDTPDAADREDTALLPGARTKTRSFPQNIELS